MSEAERRPATASWSAAPRRAMSHASPSASVWPATPWCRAGSPAPRSPIWARASIRSWRARSRSSAAPSAWPRSETTLTARCPLVYDEAFLALAAQAGVLALCRELLGDYVILMQQNGVINPSGQRHTQLAYHRDLPYQHFVSSRPLAISALFCIDPFTAETGATTVIPGVASDGAVSVRCRGGGARHRGQRRSGIVHRVRLDGVPPRRREPFRPAAPRRSIRCSRRRSSRSRSRCRRRWTAAMPATRRWPGSWAMRSAPARSVTAWRERRLARQRSASQGLRRTSAPDA